MSNQCKCASSRMFPHRADKCKLSFKKATRTSVQEPSTEEVPSFVFESVVGAESAENEMGPSIEDTAGFAVEQQTNANEISAAEVVDDELTAAQEIAISNFSLLNGNEQCDCIAYRLKKHRKKKCSWKKHAAIALATATIVAGAAVLTAVLLSDTDKDDTTDPLSSGFENINLDSTAQAENTPSPDPNGAPQGSPSPDPNTAPQGAPSPAPNTAPQGAPSPAPNTAPQGAPSPAPNSASAPSPAPNSASAPSPAAAQDEVDYESDSDDDEGKESVEVLEARLRAEIRAETWAAMQAEREAAAALLRAEREEQWRRENERQQRQQAQAIWIQQQTQNNYQHQTVQNNYSSYSSNSYSSPTYNSTPSRSYGNSRSNVGITKNGTPCKNCLKKKSRCAQHPF